MSTTKVRDVLSTSDYARFSYKRGNREIKRPHVEALKEKIRKVGQLTPIMVDPSYKVIDGQHRLEACKELGVPVEYYMTDRTITTREITELNNAPRSWKTEDYAASFAQQGLEGYKLYLHFRREFPEFGHSMALVLLSNSTSRLRGLEKDFLEGKFQVASFTKAKQQALFLKGMQLYYEGYRRRSFILAMLHIMEHPSFDKARMLRKLPKRCKDILDFSQTDDYIDTLQSIYNWKETAKVAFR